MSLLDPVRVEPTPEERVYLAEFEATYGMRLPPGTTGYSSPLVLARDKTWKLVDNFLRPIGRDYTVMLDVYSCRVSNDEIVADTADRAVDAVKVVFQRLEAHATRLCESIGSTGLLLTSQRSRDMPYTNCGTAKLLESFEAADKVYAAIERCRRERILDSAASRVEGKAVWSLYQELQAKVSALRHEMAKRMAERPNFPPGFSFL